MSNHSINQLKKELVNNFNLNKYDSCLKILTAVKIELIENGMLIPDEKNTSTKEGLENLKTVEEIYYLGFLASMWKRNYKDLEIIFLHLMCFYTCDKLYNKKGVNNEMTKAISIYLLYLLSQGSLLKFHSNLEIIYMSPLFDVEKDKFLQFPINIERSMMEGNYVEVWKLLKEQRGLPCIEYSHFVETLIKTIRYQVFLCIQQTYEKIPIATCKSLLFYSQEQSDSVFMQSLKNDLEVENWTLEKNFITFQNDENSENNRIPDITKNILSYAEQIESVI